MEKKFLVLAVIVLWVLVGCQGQMPTSIDSVGPFMLTTVPAVATVQPTATLVAPTVIQTPLVSGPPSVTVVRTPADSLSAVPRVSSQELKAWLDAGEKVVVVDVRSLASYQTKHISGAVSIPEAEVKQRQDELPREAKIVFYCT